MTAEGTCYMCDKLGGDKEHVPPRSLFPKFKPSSDEPLFRTNHRKGHLITVPSCKIHNQAKCKDDELILFTMACSERANALGRAVARYRHALTVGRNDSFMPWLARVSDTIIHTDSDGSLRRSGTFDVPLKRYLIALDRIGFGLYYHLHKRQFSGRVSSYPRELFRKNFDMAGVHLKIQQVERINELADEALADAKRIGDNPQVFFYQHGHIHDVEIIRATFYEGVQVVFRFTPAPSAPIKSNWFSRLIRALKNVVDDPGDGYDQGYRLMVLGMFDQDKWAGKDPFASNKDIGKKDRGTD